ncbi:MAG: iron ABC transporter permease [Deltaproteobacteria bacterium]|nr:iron ABC transporter permease [Deltaproteobacteria bacterium]MBW2071513.1 iron ABC transporter permease [Deltaproteobacteria bacterium]
MRATPSRITLISLLLLAVLLAVCLLSLTAGPAHLQSGAVLRELLGMRVLNDTSRTILLKIRLPRILLGALVGGTLAVAGVVFQALLRNPLAEPFILGISGGAAFGAILGILLGWAFFPGVMGASFAGALATIVLVMGIARGNARIQTNVLLLSGVIVNAFFSAAIMFLIAITRNHKIHNILHWLMGDLGFAAFKEVAVLLPLVLVGLAFVYGTARPLNLMVAGEETAIHLGVRVERLKKTLFVLVSLIVSAVVCLSGIIGFVGLIIPHALRFLVGSDHRLLLPTAFFSGAAFLVICDMLARTLTYQGELPVGVLTALFGGPFFIYLIRRTLE